MTRVIGTRHEYDHAEKESGVCGVRYYTTLYAIEALEAKRIKFGITGNIKKRFAQIRNTSPIEVKLLGHMRMPPDAEQYIFQFLKDDRSHGEWFFRTESVRSIAALIAANMGVHLAEAIGMAGRVPFEHQTSNEAGADQRYLYR